MTLKDLLKNGGLRGFPQKTPARVPSGTIWPHDEWSYGFVQPRPDGGEWHEDPYVGLGVDDVAMAQRASGGGSPLNLSVPPNSHSRPKRGLKGITGFGRNMVKAFGALVNREYPRHRPTFATLTIPTLRPRERAALAADWGEFVRQALQYLTRRLVAAGAPPLLCSVTEIQPKRLASSGQGYLHLHLLWLNIPARCGSWSVAPRDFADWAHAYLCRRFPDASIGHVNVNVKPVRGEVARYMAKYMSKGSETLAEAQEDWGADVCPSTWWNMSKTARDWVKSRTFKGRQVGELLDTFMQYVWDTGDSTPVEFVRPIEIDMDGTLVVMGWRGRFTPVVAENLRQLVECV